MGVYQLYEEWDNEWSNQYGIYLSKGDSAISYWKSYIDESSRYKFVDIELVSVNSNDPNFDSPEVKLGFKLTPLQGTIEQVSFIYSWREGVENYINYTTPFSEPIIIYKRLDSFNDWIMLGDRTVESILSDYNFYIKVRNIQKDGVNFDEFLRFLVITSENRYPRFELLYLQKTYQLHCKRSCIK